LEESIKTDYFGIPPVRISGRSDIGLLTGKRDGTRV